MSALVRRFLLLLLTLSLGLLISLLGQWLTGDERWFLAIPITLALAWLRVADTDQCSRPSCLTPSHPPRIKKSAAGSPPTTDS